MHISDKSHTAHRASPSMLTGWPNGHSVLRNGHPVMRVWPSSLAIHASLEVGHEQFLKEICCMISFERRYNKKTAVIHFFWMSVLIFIIFMQCFNDLSRLGNAYLYHDCLGSLFNAIFIIFEADMANAMPLQAVELRMKIDI